MIFTLWYYILDIVSKRRILMSNPVIIIPGIGQSKLFVADEKGNKIKNAWPVELDEKALINELKGSLVKMMLFRKDGGFSDKIAEIVNDISDPLASNPDGSKKYTIKAVTYDKSLAECTADEKRLIYKMVPLQELGEKIGEEKLFYFTFDPFGDLYDTAEKLGQFVDFVKTKTGSEKVDLISVSIGGVVLRAYLQKYGETGSVEKVLNIVSALDGTQLIADVFENKLKLDNPAGLLSSIGGKAASVASMVGMLPSDVLDGVITKSLDVIRNNLLLSCTTMWGLLPNARFDAVYNEYAHNEVLMEKIKSFHDYSLRFAENVKDMKFYQICGWGRELVPVVESYAVSSDGLIDTASASFGAVCGGTDVQPDASGCVFPDTTWFFKNQGHDATAYNDAAIALAVRIITGEVENVHSDPSFPQFNGSRNIRKLKYNLIPAAKEKLASASDEGKAELNACIADYEKMLRNTVIENNEEVKALESRLTAALEK